MLTLLDRTMAMEGDWGWEKKPPWRMSMPAEACWEPKTVLVLAAKLDEVCWPKD